MDKYIYDEKNGLWYELQGDYYLPCLKLPKEESRHIGVWGQRHLLKAENQILWVQKMNNIHNAAMEVVSNDLIYA